MKKLVILAFTAAILIPSATQAEQSIEDISAGAGLQIENIPEALNQAVDGSCSENALGRVLSTLYTRQFSLQDKLRELDSKIEKTTLDVAYLCAAFRKWATKYLAYNDSMIIELSQHPDKDGYPIASTVTEDLRAIRGKDLELRLARQEREAVLRDIAKTEEMIKNLLDKISPQGKSERLPDEL